MLKKVCFLLIMSLIILLFAACDPYRPGETEAQTLPSSAQVIPTAPLATQTVPTTHSTVHIHSYFGKTVAPTCTEGGYMLHTCDCGDQFRDGHTDPLGHSWGEWFVLTQPTDTQEGLQERKCTTCGAASQESIEKLTPSHAHDYEAVSTAPTCTQDGYTVYSCQCGDRYTVTDTNSAIGHSWSEWIVTTEPTVSAEGQQTRTCEACGATDTSTLEKLPKPHTHEYAKEKVPATCTESGYTRYSCECGDTYLEPSGDPKGHTWGNWFVSVEPTVHAQGQRQRLCQICGAEEYSILDVLESAAAFIFVCWPETIGRNQEATVIIKGQPGVTYDIDVYYKSGVSSAKGLEDQVADEQGYVTWTWKVGPSTAAGTYKILVKCGDHQQIVYFTVVVG